MPSPGFIDLQINGYKATSFSSVELTDEKCREICDQILANGNAGILPTVTTSPMSNYEHTLPLICKLIGEEKYQGKLLGLHLEGPFMSDKPGAVGAHNPDWMQDPSTEQLDRLIDLSNNTVKLLTIAADSPNAEAICRHAVSKGITVSLGHHLAEEEDLARLVDAGATLLTHLGNGLPNEIHRHHNPIYAGLMNDDLTAMIISDGHHLPATLIKVMLRCKGLDKTIITSDASSFAGMPVGTYERPGNICVLEESGLLHNPEKGCMVGSSYTMFECMNYLASLDVLNEEELWQLSFSNPLQAIGLTESDVDMSEKLDFNTSTNVYSLT
ncbi:MAG: hypothetical protein HRU15_02725 [Planctomycetes bacterium]|nr:hypothetical protein [Planctomycetota bacterium]